MKKKLIRLMMLTTTIGLLSACTDKNAGSRGKYEPDDTQEDPVVTEAPTPGEAPADPLPSGP